MPVNLYPLTQGWNNAQWDMRKLAEFDVTMPVKQAQADYLANQFYPNAGKTSNLNYDLAAEKSSDYMAQKPYREWQNTELNNTGLTIEAGRRLALGDLNGTAELMRKLNLPVPDLTTDIGRKNAADVLKASPGYATAMNLAQSEKASSAAIAYGFSPRVKDTTLTPFDMANNVAENNKKVLDVLKNNVDSYPVGSAERIAAQKKFDESFAIQQSLIGVMTNGLGNGASPPNTQAPPVANTYNATPPTPDYAARAAAVTNDRVKAGLPPLSAYDIQQIIQIPENKQRYVAPATSDVMAIPPQSMLSPQKEIAALRASMPPITNTDAYLSWQASPSAKRLAYLLQASNQNLVNQIPR